LTEARSGQADCLAQQLVSAFEFGGADAPSQQPPVELDHVPLAEVPDLHVGHRIAEEAGRDVPVSGEDRWGNAAGLDHIVHQLPDRDLPALRVLPGSVELLPPDYLDGLTREKETQLEARGVAEEMKAAREMYLQTLREEVKMGITPEWRLMQAESEPTPPELEAQLKEKIRKEMAEQLEAGRRMQVQNLIPKGRI
jgi:hypothetical protein